MAPLSLSIVQDNGTVTKKVKLEPGITVREAHGIVRDKMNVQGDASTYGLFLRSIECGVSGVWMEEHRALSYYMLRDGDRVDYINKIRNLRVKMLDDSVKTLVVDQSKIVGDLMINICAKLGITNHEEYGLRLENEEEEDETKKKKAGHTGTLTLNRKTNLKERDLQFEQHMKDLKTDDNVEWLDAHKTLSEASVAPDRTVILMRRLFYSDCNVDSRDPVQLNLLYVQTRDNILDGRHPITLDQAAEFAGIQCQIHFGDFQEDKHKAGFIENLKEYLPEQYISSWGIEKKVLKEYRKHPGLSAVDAKHLYTKRARALPTYGVTFFLVKEKQKDKKKLVPRLLGINKEAILRLDEVSKEILQEWPLTHVKTYHVAKGEIFTLNFGDYSDKEYSVKTRDAYRIRDILEDYIDLIRKRMMEQYHGNKSDSAYITQDNVQSSQANIVTHISHNPSKLVEHSFVGPSKIVQHEVGKEACQGTQIMTIKQIVVSEKGNHHQQGVKSEVGMRGDMSVPFTRRLNRLNSNSVKIVTLLTEPTKLHIEDARKIVAAMNGELSYIRDGVKDTIEKQTSDDEKKKLHDQMNELDELMRLLTSCTDPDSTATGEVGEAGDTAMKVADLTTRMYFSLDEKQRRRSKIISRSRASFVEDERTQRTLRKASFIAATTTAVHAIDHGQGILAQEYSGPLLDPQRTAELEAASVDKLGKLNAAIAHYIMAHSDPTNVDYETAVNSMHTIHELIPEFAKDAQALASTKDPQSQSQILHDAKMLCDAIKRICSSTGMEDPENVEKAAKEYTEASSRLVFTFGKGRHSDKENELLDLVDEVGGECSKLLISAQQLVQQSEQAAAEVDAVGVRVATAAKALISQVQLTAPTISEPHCQSAVTGSSEALSAAVQQLAAACRPHLEPSPLHPLGETMHRQLLDVARALDRLKLAYSGLGGDEEGDVFDHPATSQQQQRLHFISSLSANKEQCRQLEDQLAQPYPTSVKDVEVEEAQRRLSERMGHLNAAIASLLAATAERARPDYATAQIAVSALNELMPQLVQDAKLASANEDAAARASMMDHVRRLCQASQGLAACAEDTTPEARSEAIAKFTNASGKLVFGISHRGNPHKESQILKLSEDACQKASQLVSGVQTLSQAAGGEVAAALDSSGGRCADSAQSLLTTAQLTAASMSEPRCQSALLSSIDKLSSSGQDLASTWQPLKDQSAHRTHVQALGTTLGELEGKLDALKACVSADDLQSTQVASEQQKLQFVKTLSGTREQILKAERALDKPLPPSQNAEKALAIERRLSGRLGELNAAMAALGAAADPARPTYGAAEDAARTVAALLPFVVQDTQSTCANKDAATRAAMLDLLRELCEASRGVCAGADGTNAQGLSDALSKYSDASGKLVYVVSPRANANRENQITGLTAGACSAASQLLAGVEQLSLEAVGARGDALDARGAELAAAAQALLTTAQITSPTISEPHCQKTMLSSIDQVSASSEKLADTWSPLLQDPRHQKQVAELQPSLQRLKQQLETLRKACHLPDIENDGQTKIMGLSSELQKLQFDKTMSSAKAQLQKTENELDKPYPTSVKNIDVEEAQCRLSERMGHLNAAIASLLVATADRDRADYAAAEIAINTVNELMPLVVQDTKLASANEDAAARASMMDHVRRLCQASQGLAACAENTNPEARSEAIAKFTNASGKLVFGISHRGNPHKESQILKLSEDACQKASQLVSGVQTLSQAAGGEVAAALDSSGGRCADSAQSLLTTAQLTAASMSEPRCQSALLSSIDKLSSSGQDLASTWQPLKDQSAHRTHVQALGTTLGELDGKLDALKACVSADDLQSTQVASEQQKLQFVKTLSGTREHILKAERALDKPLPPSQNAEKALAIERRLSGRLGELNAAMAALGAAADPARPTYGAAEDAARTVAALLPFVVQDTQSTCANKDAATRAAMLDLLRELCEASRGVCAGADGTNAQGLGDALSKYSDASGKLVYVVSPRANANRENQITGLTAGACSAASQLLAGVEQLSLEAGGARGDALDARGAELAAAAQALLTTAQITSPTISEPHCQKTMLSSIGQVSASSEKLVDTWSPLLQDPRHQKQVAELQPSLQRLKQQLEALRKACQLPDTENDGQMMSHVENVDLPPELQKLQFVKTISSAKELLHKTEKALNKPFPPPQSSDVADTVQQRLSGRLGDLNAAIAALLAATADREKPDYKKAEQAIKTLSEIMPNVVEDTQSTCANKDAATRAAMLDLLRELCEASRGVCAGADGTNAQGLNDAASKFSHASGKLVLVSNPRNNVEREKQIMALSKEACRTTDKLLSCVQKLDTSVEGQTGQELEVKGRAVRSSAQTMLGTANVTAPWMSSPACKAAMLSAVERVSASSADLVSSWKPLLAGREWSSLRAPLLQLEGELADLRRVCHLPDEDIKITKSHQIQPIPTHNHKQEFAKSVSGAKEQIQKAQKALDKPLPPPQNSDKADKIQERLSVRLGDLNAAIAALLTATSDHDKPDYKSAAQAAKTITDLMPYVVQDTQSTCANKDAATRAAMLDLLRELCEASRGVCAGADGTDAQGLNDAVSKFSAASGKLVYVVSPAVNEKREKQIIGLAAGACNNTSQLLSGVERLAQGVGGNKGQELDAKGALLADAAQNLLATSQLAAPSLSSPPCKQALQSSIEHASSCSRALAAACQPLLQDPQHQNQALSLQVPLQQLDGQLEAMRKACQIPDEVKIRKAPLEQQKLHLKQSMSVAEEQIQDAQKALARPVPPALSNEQAEAVQLKLSGRLGELNAAIADLLSAPVDRNKPYYETAEKAVKTIANLLPEVIQDTQAVSAGKDAATRAAMLDLLRGLCEASRGVCAGADGTDPKGLSEAVGKFSDASGKLVYVVSPHVNSDREQEIVELSAGACNLTSQLLSGVQQLSEAVGGAPARELDERGAELADGAQALLASAQVTAPSISSPQCKASLLSTIELVSDRSQELSTCLQPLLQEPRHKQRTAALQQALRQLHVQLAALRRACGDTDHALGPHSAPSTPTRRSSRLPPPPAPPRTVSIIGDHSAGNKAHLATREFLDRVRCEESQGNKSAPPPPGGAALPPPPTAITDDEKRMHQQFLLSIDDADKTIRKVEDTVKQMSKNEGGGGVAVSAGECMAKQARLQRNIALAGVAVAALVGANYADTIDYTSATKSTKTLPQLMNTIVEDGKVLSSTVGQESRRAFLEDMLQMCHSTRKLCDAAKNDREKLNDAAVEFGDKSTKLLYVVSNDVDPTLEKEIISRAKAIGDGVAQISVKAGEVAGGPCAVEGAVGALCSAGARCQDVAGKLIYTAKLVAPSIHEPPCQDALLRAGDALGSELRAFSTSWQPFSTEPHHARTVRELVKDAENLHRILEGLKSDVKGGRLGQRREIERLVVEDTPMRQLTLKIMEDAKKLSVSQEQSPALRREYIEYCNKLSDALRSLDLANARCKRTPHDTNKRRELENCIQNLQMILLQTRPKRGDKEKSNIVDLRDFIDEVSTEADKMAAIASDHKVPAAADRKTLQDINSSGQKISRAAYKLTHSDDAPGFDTAFEDILDVDQFGQECDDIIMDMIAQIQTLDDVKTKNALLSKILPLSESCNMLRFATKSGISDSKSVSLESTLDDLDDIESRVIQSIVKDKSEASGITLRFAPQPGKAAAVESVARSELCRAVCCQQGWVPRAPLTAYIASCAAAADSHADNRNRLLRHLFKLVHLLKTQTVVISKRIATWQSVDDPEVATIVQQILQEIQNPEEKFQADDSKVKKILNESDLTKLLIPSPANIVGDLKQQEEKLSKLATKLNSMCGTLTLSIASPEALARSAHAAAEAAVELSAVARGCKNSKDSVQCERIEKAVQEMTFTTYGALKTAELACLDNTNPLAKRRLVDACRKLNDAINIMVVSASTASALKKECGSLCRALALQTAGLQALPAVTSALPFHECCAALDQHQEIVYKLKSEQPMMRQEFVRSLHEVHAAVCRTTEISSQCAYLISVSEKDSEISKKGPVDVPQIQQTIESLQDSCMAIIGAPNVAQAKEEIDDLHKRVQDFSRALDEAQMKVKEGGAKATLTRAKGGVTTSAAALWDCLKEEDDMDKVTTSAVILLEEVNRSHALIERCPLVPSAGEMSAETKARCDELCNNSKILLGHTLALVKDVDALDDDDDEMLTWVTFSTNKTKLLDAYDALLKSIRVNGQRAGIIEGSPEDEVDEDAQNKTYLDVQVDLANKWLLKPMCKVEVKTNGQQAVRHVIDIATKMSEELKGSEREEIRHLITETEELLVHCSARYDNEKYSVLVDRIKELKKSIHRGVVTRVVEDFIEDSAAAELDLLVDAEEDDQKRKFLLERKIAELLAQLGRVTRTARFVSQAAGAHSASAQIAHCTEQTELLAPMLVQAAQDRIASPNDQAVIANYKALLAKYAESVSKVRSMCDCAVDPMDFVQTAGETMQRMREESSADNDVQKGHRTSEAIIKLANRSIEVSMSSLAVRRDPELRLELQAAQRRLIAATPAADTRRSRLPDWKESTAEVLRTTGEVESVLGGENIFKKQPTAQGSNQQIYSVARELHESVREWSSRDNEIVGVARRMAVLMARLSEYMETDKKQALISTSKSIVSESHEVAALARKLAHECTDVRIKTNLLQTCERIPTISAQLKMLTAVKGSSLGQQGSKEDTEAMDMLVVNAQSLMLSIQEVVKAAAGASVKIMSQRGPRLRWVRKNYY